MSKHLKGFMDFVREQGVVGLAIGLAVGTQAAILVKDMIKAIVDPIIGLYDLLLLLFVVHGLKLDKADKKKK